VRVYHSQVYKSIRKPAKNEKKRMWAEKKSSQSLAEWLIWFPCTSEESGRGGVWVISWNFLWQPLGGWVNNGHQRKQLLRSALSSPLDGPILSPIPGILGTQHLRLMEKVLRLPLPNTHVTAASLLRLGFRFMTL